MMNLIKRLRNEESGAAMVEYGLLIALIALVVLGAATTLGDNISTLYETIAGKL